MSTSILTIGHSNHTWESFVSLLKAQEVEVLVDIRTEPVSKHAPFASSRTLPRLLELEGMRYLFLGDSLGGKPADRSCYDHRGKPDYPKIRSKGFFKAGMEQLIRLAAEARVAIMCAEEDPGKCHRWLLLGPALEQGDVAMQDSRELRSKPAYRRQLQGTLPLLDQAE